MKVRLIAGRCVGHGMCRMACPEVFSLNEDDGLAIVLTELVPTALEAAVDLARRGCPEQAIIIDR